MRAADADLATMRRALDLARRSREAPPVDLPVGAIVTDSEGTPIAQAVNHRRGGTDPTAHAEIVALRRAGERLGTWRLDGCSLFVTLEPCPMCAGAAVNARVRRLVFGAWNPDYGACGSLFDIPRDRRLHHRPEVVSGVLANECSALIQDFFVQVRAPDIEAGS